MKKIITLLFFLSEVCCIYSQDCFDKIERQAVVIDSLKKELSVKSDSISILRIQFLDEKSNGLKIETADSLKLKAQAFDAWIQSYETMSFDSLILTCTKESVQRDKQLVGDNQKIKTTLDDLLKYFSAKEILSKKYDEYRVKDAQKQLEQVTQKSANIDKLKELLGNFQTFNEGLKETLKKIVDLDNRETVERMSDEVRQKKFNKIFAEISAYIFNYDFNFSDYPYLSDILLEIFKRKQPDVDANISDLLQKL
jgi:hypothetical protein